MSHMIDSVTRFGGAVILQRWRQERRNVEYSVMVDIFILPSSSYNPTAYRAGRTLDLRLQPARKETIVSRISSFANPLTQ